MLALVIQVPVSQIARAELGTSYPTPLESRVNLEYLFDRCPDLRIAVAVASILSFCHAKTLASESKRRITHLRHILPTKIARKSQLPV
jgi:hypothetical protein